MTSQSDGGGISIPMLPASYGSPFEVSPATGDRFFGARLVFPPDCLRSGRGHTVDGLHGGKSEIMCRYLR